MLYGDSYLSIDMAFNIETQNVYFCSLLFNTSVYVVPLVL